MTFRHTSSAAARDAVHAVAALEETDPPVRRRRGVCRARPCRAMELHRDARGPKTVLVADDDDDMRALVAATLRGDGYRVLEARDGAELLEQLETAIQDPVARPDVVVTDVMMPKLSGLGVLDAIRRAQLHFPVILMTVLSDRSVFIVAKRLGAVGVLLKPFDVDDLRTAVLNARSLHERAH